MESKPRYLIKKLTDKLKFLFISFIALINASCNNKSSSNMEHNVNEEIQYPSSYVNAYNKAALILARNPFDKDSILKSLKKFNEAEEFYTKDFRLYTSKIHVYLLLDSVEDAKRYAHKLISSKKDSYTGYIILGNIYNVNMKQDSAVFFYKLAENKIKDKISHSLSNNNYLSDLILIKTILNKKHAFNYLLDLKNKELIDDEVFKNYKLIIDSFDKNGYLNNYRSRFY